MGKAMLYWASWLDSAANLVAWYSDGPELYILGKCRHKASSLQKHVVCRKSAFDDENVCFNSFFSIIFSNHLSPQVLHCWVLNGSGY